MKASLQDEASQNSAISSRTKQNPDSLQSQPALKCPRCDSTNTKFCYYNNYNLTQPRHFCKTCRRYWTKGGALRNIPIGGGCRKNKRFKSSSSSSSSNSKLTAGGDSLGFKFFTGISPTIDFGAIGGGGGLSSSSSLFPCSRFSLGQTAAISPAANYSFVGLNYDNSSLNDNTQQLASSIESLSSLNQDLHWKLQQQRLAMIFGDHDHEAAVQNKDQNQKFLQPISFQNLDAQKQDTFFNNNHPRKESAAAAAPTSTTTTTEWYFGNNNSYQHHHQVSTANNTSRNIGSNGGGSGWNNNGVQAWEDLLHFTALP